jgi:hypothetical protein
LSRRVEVRMSLGTYWRLALLLPVLGPVLLIAVAGGILHLANSSTDPADRPESVGAMLRDLAVEGTRTAVWPAYAVWCAGFLIGTRRFPAPRLRRALWFAPLSYAPLLAALWAATDAALGRNRDVGEYAIIAGVLLVAALLAGYVAMLLAWAFEQLGLRTGLVRPAAPAPAN